jgi:hypothetical protein
MLGTGLNVELTLTASLSPAEFDGFTASQKLSTYHQVSLVVSWQCCETYYYYYCAMGSQSCERREPNLQLGCRVASAHMYVPCPVVDFI